MPETIEVRCDFCDAKHSIRKERIDSDGYEYVSEHRCV